MCFVNGDQVKNCSGTQVENVPTCEEEEKFIPFVEVQTQKVTALWVRVTAEQFISRIQGGGKKKNHKETNKKRYS